MSDPKAIVGCFASRPDVEWSVAVGCRVRHVHADRLCTVTALHHGRVMVHWDGEREPVCWALASFWLNYEPAPRESRWLDPASVPVGPAMARCNWGSAHGPRNQCAYASVSGSDGCSVHANEHRKPPTHFFPARLPPSALTPAARWKHKPPRIRHTNLAYIRCGDQEDEGSNFVFHAPRKNSLVRKVREGVRVSQVGATSAGWTAV